MVTAVILLNVERSQIKAVGEALAAFPEAASV